MKKSVPRGKLLLLPHRSFLKLFLIMKMTFALILLTAMQVFAGNGNAQNVTLNLKQTEIPKVFRAIEKQSPYRFLYNYDLPALQKKIDVNVNDVPVTLLLNDLLSGSGLSYKIMNGGLVVIMSSSNIKETKKITGKVLTESGEPMVGVSVRIKGSNYGTVTDSKGVFSIEVPDGAVLIFSSIGYEPQEITPGNSSSVNVTLKQSVNQMEQVVVVGYGTQRKKDITGSVSSISSKDLENRPNTQFGYSIEGKAAGVQVIRSSGQPQVGFSIRVRGTSSINAVSEPLYVVDGVPTSNTNDINPADIESISILKDASSAAIYGAGGANGVVLITTKRGKNQKLKLNFNTSLTMSSAWKRMKMLNGTEFQELATEMGKTTDWTKYNKNTNWQDEIFRNALSQNYQLSATGGTKKTSYYLSGSLINQNGIVLNNSLNRATIKANVDQHVTSFLKVGTSFSYDNWKDIDVSENDRNGVITRLYTSIPNIGIWDTDNPEQYARSPFINDLENPVSTVYQPVHSYKNDRFHGNVYAEAEVIKGLKIKSLFGFEHTDGVYNSFQDSVKTRYGKSQKGIAAKYTYKYKYWVSENTANYNTRIKDHSISAMGGFIVERGITDNIYLSGHDFTGAKDNDVTSANVQSPPIPEYIQRSKASVIGRINYSYKEKYLFTSNFRTDGSGQFSEKHKWGYFPSFSAGWRISNEDFFRNVRGINELKLRIGYGVFGNDRARAYAWYGLVDTLSRYLINGERTAFTSSTLENQDLRWEHTAQTDIGFDVSFLNSRILFTADYYYKKTKDLLLEVPVPTSTGFSSALQNAGSLENKGFEFSISTKNIISSNFKWNTDFNISTNKGKVLDIVGTTMQTGTINPAGTSLNTVIVKAGSPLGSFYGRIAQGVDKNTGRIVFMQNAANTGDSVGIIGNANPKFMYGLSNSFTFGKFTVDIFLQGVHGNQILNATRILTESMALPMNQAASVLRRWRKAGDVTDMPGISPSDWSNSAVSTRYIEDGSYLRVKALTFGYSVPFEKKAKISRLNIYLTAENLLTFTKYSGFDPEVSAFSGKSQGTTNQNTAPGVDYGTYPQAREFILGLNISF